MEARFYRVLWYCDLFVRSVLPWSITSAATAAIVVGLSRSRRPGETMRPDKSSVRLCSLLVAMNAVHVATLSPFMVFYLTEASISRTMTPRQFLLYYTFKVRLP